jgi:hypothetical protein
VAPPDQREAPPDQRVASELRVPSKERKKDQMVATPEPSSE